MDVKQLLKNPPVWDPSLNDRPELVEELVGWLKDKEVSIRQAVGLLGVTKALIDESWRMEKDNVKF